MTGVVRGVAGRPVVEAMVVLIRRDGAVLGSATTGPDGRFRVDDVPPGRHMLTASGFGPVTGQVAVAGHSTEVDLAVELPSTAGDPVPDAPRATASAAT